MNLKGTKTEKNLNEAFAGESMARNKYTYYASKAKNCLLYTSSSCFLIKQAIQRAFISMLINSFIIVL